MMKSFFGDILFLRAIIVDSAVRPEAGWRRYGV